MAITIDYTTRVISIPKADMTLVQSTPNEVRELDTNQFRLTLKDIEDDIGGIPFVDTHVHFTEVSIGGVVYARLVQIINGYTVTFEDGQYIVNLVGSNNNILDVTNLNQVSVRPSNAAGLISNSAIEYSSFNGGVTIDVVNGAAGTVYNIGTPQNPVNNLADALLIAEVRGFDTLIFKSDFTFESGDDVTLYTLRGVSQAGTTLTFNSGCITAGCNIELATVQGTLVSPQSFHDCTFLNITGGTVGAVGTMEVERCVFDGTITLSASLEGEINLVNCISGIPGTTDPIFDVNGADVDVVIRNYSGGMDIRNVTQSTTDISIDMHSGHVTLASTCTAGTIIVRGRGKLTDNSGGAVVDANHFITGDKFTDIKHSVQSLKGFGRAFGSVYYVDSVNGSNSNPGTDPERAFSTITYALSKCEDYKGDILYLLARGSDEVHIDETVTINKADVSLIGPGSYLHIHPTTSGTNTVTVTAEGVTLSGLSVWTAAGGTDDGVVVSGNDFSMEYVRINSCTGRSLVMSGTSRGQARECFFGYSGGDNLHITDSVDTSFIDCHLDEAGGDNVKLIATVAEATHEIAIRNCIIHGAGGYGINIGTNCDTIQIMDNCKFIDNTTADVLDNGTGTYNETTTNTTIIATSVTESVWDEAISDHTVSGSFGEQVGGKLLTIAKFLGLK